MTIDQASHHIKPRRKRKFLLAAVLALGILGAIAHFSWKYSGSGRWEFHSDEGGVVIYKMKTPGISLMKFKAVGRVKSSLENAVASMRDTGVASCSKWVPGCASDKIIKPWNPVSLSEVHLWHVDLPSPLSPREFLLETKFTPEPAKRTVFIEFIARPSLLPENECCYRIVHMQNSWRFTEVESGEIEVVSVQDMDVGLPYFMLNFVGPKSIRKLFSKLPDIFGDKKYDGINYEFMQPGGV